MIHPFLRRIAAGPLLGDGAMGTLLYSRGVSFERCFEELNVSAPTLVQQIHRDYLAAGAELIETNTFGGNRFRLALHGCEGRVRELNLRAVKLAREAREIAGEPAFVAGSVGPIGRVLEPFGDVSLDAARSAFREQIEAILEGGADLILLETFSRLDELLAALDAARSVTDLPIVAQVTIDEDGRTLDGQALGEVARAVEGAGASVVGVNCGVGPQGTLAAVEELVRATKLPVSAMPNAGLPQRFGGRFVYFTTPEYFGDYAGRLVATGARIVGGCCGTTPAHIAAMRAALREALPVTAPVAPARIEVAASEPPAEKTTAVAPTHLARLFAERKFAVSVELDPPRGINPAKMLAGAKALKEAGVDVFNIADSPMARVRMSCLAAARLTMEATGLEVIIHFTTRDRNLMALQSELIGGHATGIRNVLALTGDPPRLGDYPNATGVWDVDSIGLIKILKGLNAGKDWAGTSIGRSASFFVGAAVNPTAEDITAELDRFRQKLDAGADFVMSQPLYDIDTLRRFLDRVGGYLRAPLLLGIMPVQSFRHAEFLHNEVPGITLPAELLERMERAGEKGIAEGLAQAQEFLSQAMAEAQGLISGTYLMPSFGRYEVVGELVRGLSTDSTERLRKNLAP